MEKNEAFEIVVSALSQVRLSMQEWEIVKEAVTIISTELDYKAEDKEVVEDLEKSSKK